MSLDDVAEKVGVGRMLIFQYEHGLRHPTRETVARLSAALDCPELEEHFFTREDVRDIRSEPMLVNAVKRLMKKMGLS